MFGEMTIARGRVRELLNPQETPHGAAPSALNLDGRYLWVNDFSEEYRAKLREGEELIVVGHDRGEVLAACACRNVTRHHNQRASVFSDVFWGVVGLAITLIAAWASWTSDAETPLFFWLQRFGFAGLAIVLTLISGVYFFSMIQKFRAEYLVTIAALETIRGTAETVKQILWADPERHVPRFDIAGRPTRFAISRVLKIRDGDEVIVAGHHGGDAFVGFDLRNVTQSVSERSWDRGSRWEVFPTVIFFVIPSIGLLSPAMLDDYEFMIALRYVVLLAIWSTAAVVLVSRFYSWKVDREAGRRVCE